MLFGAFSGVYIRVSFVWLRTLYVVIMMYICSSFGIALISMSITKPVLNKINALTTNCREAYLILENTYGGNLTVAEMAFLDNMLDKKKETTESAETFIENWIQLSLQTGITRTKENDTRQLV